MWTYLNIARRLLLAGAAIYGLLFLPSLFDIQRELFGVRDGNLVAAIEICLPICAYLLYDLSKRGKQARAKAGGWLVAAVFAAFLGWFVHPDQVHQRAVDRLADWKDATINYEQRQANQPTDTAKQAGIRYRRLQEEQSARELEAQAASVRYDGEPGFYRSPYYTWSFWGFGIFFLLNGLFFIFAGRKEAPSPKTNADSLS